MNHAHSSPDPQEVTSPASHRRVAWGAAVVAILAGLVILWRLRSSRAMDDDELQHMHFAWCLTQGLVPYRDFWDNHPPLLHHLLAFLIDGAGPPSTAFGAGRSLMVLFALTAVGPTYLMGKTCFGAAAGMLGAAWLACHEVFLLKAVEIRPDALMAGFATLGLALTAMHVRGGGLEASPVKPGPPGAGDEEPRRTSGRPAAVLGLGVGACLGTAFILSTKAAVMVLLAAGGWTWSLLPIAPRSRRASLPGLLCGVLGFLIPLATWIAPALSNGSAAAAWRMTVLENILYPQRFNPWALLASTQPYALLLAAMVGLAAVRRDAGTPGDRAARAFAAACAVLTTLAYALMPAAYLQSALIALPCLCVLAGWGTWRLLEGWVPFAKARRRWVCCAGCAAFIVFGVVRPLWRVAKRMPAEGAQWVAALALGDRLHDLTCEGDVVFDGRCQAVFRSHAGFYPALVQGVLVRHREGTLQPSATELSSGHAPTVVLKDSRSEKLPRGDWERIESNYVAMPPPWEWVLLPGWNIVPPDPRAAEVVTSICPPVEGVYTVERDSPATRVYLDGTETPGEVFMRVGAHTLRLAAPVAPVVLRRYPGQARGDRPDVATDGPLPP